MTLKVGHDHDRTLTSRYDIVDLHLAINSKIDILTT